MTRQRGHCARTASAVPSLEPLSTSVSVVSAVAAASVARRQRRVSSRVL
jgi:hypothetical protein